MDMVAEIGKHKCDSDGKSATCLASFHLSNQILITYNYRAEQILLITLSTILSHLLLPNSKTLASDEIL